jgi:hypothetical protein
MGHRGAKIVEKGPRSLISYMSSCRISKPVTCRSSLTWAFAVVSRRVTLFESQIRGISSALSWPRSATPTAGILFGESGGSQGKHGLAIINSLVMRISRGISACSKFVHNGRDESVLLFDAT